MELFEIVKEDNIIFYAICLLTFSVAILVYCIGGATGSDDDLKEKVGLSSDIRDMRKEETDKYNNSCLGSFRTKVKFNKDQMESGKLPKIKLAESEWSKQSDKQKSSKGKEEAADKTTEGENDEDTDIEEDTEAPSSDKFASDIQTDYSEIVLSTVDYMGFDGDIQRKKKEKKKEKTKKKKAGGENDKNGKITSKQQKHPAEKSPGATEKAGKPAKQSASQGAKTASTVRKNSVKPAATSKTDPVSGARRNSNKKQKVAPAPGNDDTKSQASSKARRESLATSNKEENPVKIAEEYPNKKHPYNVLDVSDYKTGVKPAWVDSLDLGIECQSVTSVVTKEKGKNDGGEYPEAEVKKSKKAKSLKTKKSKK